MFYQNLVCLSNQILICTTKSQKEIFMKEVIKIGYVGLGRRGLSMFDHAISKMKDVDVKYLCDLDETKMQKAQKILETRGKHQAIETFDYHDILKDPEIDAVFFFTNWDGRVQQAKESMLAGKYTGIEVGCAESLEDCFELVEIYEKNKVPLMMLENICYGKRELAALNMVKKGLFGEIVHCTGGYCHYLNDEELFREMTFDKGDKVTHYRLGHYIHHNSENYPTHALGPLCKCLGINRGNRLATLSTFTSKSRGLKDFAETRFGKDNEYAKIDYKQGDIATTVITCENGETIVLTLDTTLPRLNYSRMFGIRGTKGMLSEDHKAVFTVGMEHNQLGNEQEFFTKYEHPLQKDVRIFETDETKIKETFGMHSDGVDWMVFRAFIESAKNGTNTPIDVYDTATLLAIGPLSKMSVKNGGAPVEIPDFTKGKYKNREPYPRTKYCLEEIIEDDSFHVFDCLLTKDSE